MIVIQHLNNQFFYMEINLLFCNYNGCYYSNYQNMNSNKLQFLTTNHSHVMSVCKKKFANLYIAINILTTSLL